jgi:hypothetical protein
VQTAAKITSQIRDVEWSGSIAFGPELAWQSGYRTPDSAAASGFRNLGRAALARADEQARRGVDPAPGLDQVLRFIEQLAGDQALPTRVDALSTVRARRASITYNAPDMKGGGRW